MRPYFTRERFGRPQFLAGLLLIAFFAQGVWLVRTELRGSTDLGAQESLRVREGWKQWHVRGIAGAPFSENPKAEMQNPFQIEPSGFDPEHSPLLYLASAAPLMAWPAHFDPDSASYWRWLPRLPFLLCGVLLGASLWYVARRLCGNAGGFIALTLYCFSPSLIQSSAVWHTEPEIVTAWGAFGTVFTAIAVAHTLYAPREVILWNWRRIVLLGVAGAIAVGTQFSMIVVIPMALAFLLYVAPVRRRAGLVIWVASCCGGSILLFGVYFFHPGTFAQGMRHAMFWGATWRGFTVPGVYKQVAIEIGRSCPTFVLLLPISLVAYSLWPRTRYFGNSAPLLVGIVFVILAMAHPHSGGAGFLVAAIPFLFVFVSGVLADLMETHHGALVTACIIGIMAAYVVYSVSKLLEVPAG